MKIQKGTAAVLIVVADRFMENKLIKNFQPSQLCCMPCENY